jgi:DNA primase
MAKTYIDIVKYMINAKFEISGMVERPDIIGAVFGQTEGLLGGGLDLRELQKNGKIGRIEIETSLAESRTIGRLLLPSSLGRVETCILAAAIESVDRVGPFETSFKVEKIEDTRNEKRRKIITRAKDLLKTLLTTEIPDSKEISEIVEADVKSSVVTTYGSENMPAGPDVATSQEVIFVEGRADVVNLLKNDIDNCIAIGGALGSIPQTIIDLSKSKETTLFVDGDRGGDMIIRSVLNVADIDFVAKAPEGKEVEELTRKDIIKSLRSRVPIEQVVPALKNAPTEEQQQARRQEQFNSRQRFQQRQRPRDEPAPARSMPQPQQPQQPQPQQIQRAAPPQQQQPTQILSPSEISKRILSRPEAREAALQEHMPQELDIKDMHGSEPAGGIESIPMMGRQAASPAAKGAAEADPKFLASLEELHNTLRGRLYGANGEMITEVPIRELIQTVQDTQNIKAIVFDGIITQRLVELASRQGVKAVYGVRASQLSRLMEDMLLYTKEQGKLQ